MIALLLGVYLWAGITTAYAARHKIRECHQIHEQKTKRPSPPIEFSYIMIAMFWPILPITGDQE